MTKTTTNYGHVAKIYASFGFGRKYRKDIRNKINQKDIYVVLTMRL